MPMKTSSSPYSAGPVFRNIAQLCTVFLSASVRRLRLISETGIKFQVLPGGNESPAPMSYERRKESGCEGDKSERNHASHQCDGGRSNHNYDEPGSSQRREPWTNIQGHGQYQTDSSQRLANAYKTEKHDRQWHGPDKSLRW